MTFTFKTEPNRTAKTPNGDLAYLQLSGRMSRIRDYIYAVMRSVLVLKETEEWQHLEDALKEVYDGKVYRRRGAIEGGRGARGGRGGGRGGGGTGVVIRSWFLLCYVWTSLIIFSDVTFG